MLIQILALGTLWFWLLLATVSCILFALIENERFVWATVVLAVTVGALYLFGDVNLVGAVFRHPTEAGLVVLGYFLAGTLWGVIKWWFYVQRERRHYEEFKAEWLEARRVSGVVVPPELRKEFREAVGQRFDKSWSDRYYHPAYRSGQDDDRKEEPAEVPMPCIVPKARDHKAQILGWMIYWPWSLIWTLINDPVKRAFKWIYHQIQDLLQKISDRAFKGTEEDLS